MSESFVYISACSFAGERKQLSLRMPLDNIIPRLLSFALAGCKPEDYMTSSAAFSAQYTYM